MAIIRCKINVSKIDKTKMFKGEKGTYLDCTLLENRDGEDQYGNTHMIIQDVSKEDRAAGVKGAILGNAKTVGAKPQPAPAAKPAQGDAPPADDDSGSVPF